MREAYFISFWIVQEPQGRQYGNSAAGSICGSQGNVSEKLLVKARRTHEKQWEKRGFVERHGTELQVPREHNAPQDSSGETNLTKGTRS